jgi:hypothetical protein
MLKNTTVDLKTLALPTKGPCCSTNCLMLFLGAVFLIRRISASRVFICTLLHFIFQPAKCFLASNMAYSVYTMFSLCKQALDKFFKYAIT